MVYEGRRGVAVDHVVGEEALAGWPMEEGVGLRGFLRPQCTNGWADGMGVGNHGLGTRLSEMWESYELIPHLKCRTSRRLGIARISQIFAGNDFGRGEGVLPPTVGAHGV